MTKKLRNILLIGLAAFAALIVVLALVVPHLMDVNRYRPQIEALLRDKLHRDVKLGNMGVSLLPGVAIAVDDVSIAGESPAAPPSIEVGTLRIGAGLLPLLQKRLEISDIVLERAVVRVARRADGSFDLMDLAGGSSPREGGAAFSIDAITARKSRVIMSDASVIPGKVVEWEVDELDAVVTGLSRKDGTRHVKASGSLPSTGGKGTLAVDLTLKTGGEVEGSVVAKDVEMGRISAYSHAFAGLPPMKGEVSLDATFNRRSDKSLAANGTISVASLVTASGAKGAAPLDARAKFDIARDAAGKMTFDKVAIETGKARLAVSGSMSEEAGRQVLSLVIDAPRLSPRDLSSAAAAFGVTIPSDAVGGDDIRFSTQARIVRGPATGPAGTRALEEVALDSARLSGARLSVERRKDGTFVVNGLGRQESTRRKSGSGPRFSARDVAIDGVTLRLVDASLPSGKVSMDLTELHAKVGALSPGKSADVEFSAKALGGTLEARGRVGPTGTGPLPLDLAIAVKGLALESLKPWLEQRAGLAIGGGSCELKTQISRTGADALTLKGVLSLTRAKVGVSGREVGPVDLRIDHDLLFEKEGERVTLKSVTLGLPGVELALDGRIALPDGEAVAYEIGTSRPALLTSADVQLLAGLLSAKVPVELETSEPIALEARIRKSASGSEASGKVRLRKVTVRHRLLLQPLQVAQADLTLAGDTVSIDDAVLRLGRSDLAGNLKLDGFDTHRVSFDFVSEQADLDELFAFASQQRADAAPPANPNAPDHLGKTLATGTLRVGKATLGGLHFDDFSSTVRLEHGKLTMDPVGLSLYSGSANGNVGVDLTGSAPAFSSRVALAGVDVQSLLREGVKYEQLKGTGRVDLDIRGSTAGGAANAIRSVEGSGSFELRQGELRGLNMLKTLEKASVFGEQTLATLGRKLAADGTSFDQATATYALSGGVLTIRDLKTRTPEGDIAAKGTASLVDQRLDIDARMLFSEELSKALKAEGSKAAQLFWDSKTSRVLLPLKLVGTLKEPKATIDWNEAAGRYAREQVLGGLVGGLLGGKEPEPSGTSAPSGASAPAKEPVPSSGGFIPPWAAGRKTPSPADSSSTTSQPAPDSAPSPRSPVVQTKAPAGAPVVVLEPLGWGGNDFMPELKIKATISGKNLSHVVIVIKDQDGRVLRKSDPGWEKQVAAYYETHPRDQSASIACSSSVGADKLLGAKEITVEITPMDAGGVAGAMVSAKVAKKGLL